MTKKSFEYDTNDRLKTTGLFNALESLYEKVLGFFPILCILTSHHEPVIKRTLFPAIFVRKPGIWSFRNIYDAILFKWLNYQIEGSLKLEDEAEEIVSDYTNDQQNLALISALLLTVWAGFLTYLLDNFESNIVNIAALVFFALATISSFCSTLLPVFLCMTTGATRLPMDALYFLEILDRSTFGLGSQSAIIFLYLSGLAATIALFLAILAVTDIITTVIVFAGMAIPIVFFVQIYLQIVSCMYCTMKSGDRVAFEKQPTTLTFGELKKRLEGFLKFHDAISADDLDADCSADSFVKYIEEDSNETPIQLNTLTAKRARQLYTTFIEKNVFESFPAETLIIASKEDLVKSTD